MLFFYNCDILGHGCWRLAEKKGCGNVMHGLASLCHEAGISGNNGRRCPKYVRTVFLSDRDSIFLLSPCEYFLSRFPSARKRREAGMRSQYNN
jgi:hypothetical protein